MPSIYDNTPDEGIIEAILSYETELKEVKNKIDRAKSALVDRKQAEINSALAKKLDPFGAVSQNIGNQKITFTTPKKVEWDQEGLAKLYAQIAADPEENADEYIIVEYKVKEDAYKNWPSNLKETFEPYRTVTPGNVAVKIEPAKEK